MIVALVLASPVTPTPTNIRGGGGPPHGPAFIIAFLILGGLLWLSFWRLRRRLPGPEN